jgi:succinoglycan biosynthesis protein ExoA
VLIVIPSLNEQAHIEDVIATLQADPACADALIVVADGGSRDDTVAIVARIGRADPRVHVIPTDTPLGISASINAAVKKFAAGRTWMVRIDAHAEYPDRYASRLVEKARETGAVAVVTPMRTKGATCFQQAAAAAQNSALGNGGAAHRSTGRSGWVEHGHHALMRLDAYIAAGGYDETFSHNEDAELDRRLAKNGGRIWLAADLELVYYPRKTPRALFRQYFFYGRGRAMTIARHGGRRRLRQVLPLAVAPMVGLVLVAPLFWPAALPTLGWVILCLGYGAWLGRNNPPCAAGAGIPAMIMHFAWSAGYWSQLLKGPRPSPFEPAVTPSEIVL